MSDERNRLFDIILEEQKETRAELKELSNSINNYHNDMKWIVRIGNAITAAASVFIVKVMDLLHIFK